MWPQTSNFASSHDVLAWVGRVMDEGDAPGIAAAKKAGNKMIVLDEAEVARWKAVAAPLVEQYIAEMNAKGYDGAAMVADDKALPHYLAFEKAVYDSLN